MNGVLIYDGKQKGYAQILPISPQTVTTVIAALKSLHVTGLMYQIIGNEQMTYYETLDPKPLRDFVESRKTRYNKTFQQISSFADIPPDNLIYFTLLDTQDKILAIHDALSEVCGISRLMYKDIYSADLWYLEIHSDKASKQSGVNYLREAYGFERIVGFGDNLSDLPLFAACDVRVAVESAQPEVKAAADYLCGANSADGAIKWLEENVNG